ncbi:Deleted in lung and esophageal cancer protein 1 [Bulinus truncatus]|nr:Deleted in lung and esophageal cancer protein 1 [Bulinus truncatus]
MSLLKPKNGARGQEPPMYIQRPSASQSQDVRHILARIFRDLYTRDTIRPDTVKNLQTSKYGDDAYHERYVENLQKIYAEWQHRMDEAAMLERHIMQAQARAMSADERALNKASKSCDNFDALGLPPVRAHFKSCIDTELLRKHNLLTPSDYMVQEPISVPAPKAPEIPIYARETLASQQHSRLNTQHLQPSPRSAITGVSEDFPTILSEEDVNNRLTRKHESPGILPEFPKKVGWKEFLCEEQREIDRRDLDIMNAKVNYLKNPRFIPPENVPSLIKPLRKKNKDGDLHVEPKRRPSSPVILVPYPSTVEFTDYKVGEVYEITLELKNMSSVMRNCRVLPPSSNIFSVGLGQFPGDNGLIAPGMSCRYDIRFAPNSLKDYDDSITIQTQGSKPIIVPLKGRRPPPILTLPKEIDVGCCLVGGMQVTHLLVKNEGGPGRFCLMTRNKWPSTSFRSLMSNLNKLNVKQSPFLIVPSTFELMHDQTIILEVFFSPQSIRSYSQEMVTVCDNCHLSHFKIKGEGQIVKVGIPEESTKVFSEPLIGEFKDISAQYHLKFDDLNPFTYTEKKISIRNYTKVDVPYQWVFYKPIINANEDGCNLRNTQKDQERAPEMDGVFSVHPPSGILKPSDVTEFMFTFAPPKEKNYHSTAHLLLQHIPFSRDLVNISEEDLSTSPLSNQEDEPSTSHVTSGVHSTDITGVEIEVKGNCVPLNVVLHPYAIILQPSALIGTTIKRLFTMANHSFSTISFQWDSYVKNYIVEVEPPYGELDPGMAMDLEISITGVEAGQIKHTLFCHVVHLHEPLPLYIQAQFKGPELTILEPSIYFGLVKVGELAVKEMTVLNTSEMKVNFSVQNVRDERADSDKGNYNDLQFSETSGEIRPLERKTIQLTFRPSIVQHLKTICEVKCENGNTSSIAVHGEAQNPVVCFLECNKTLQDVYLDVPFVFQAVLHNQTLLPSTYRWEKVEGSQSDYCSIEVDDLEGKILSWEQKPITIKFTPFKPLEFNDLRIPCCLKDQKEKLYLNIVCKVKTLNVAYKTSTEKTDLSENLQLHFGSTVKLGQLVKRYVHIFNQTAIPAHFKVEADYFPAPLVLSSDANDPATSQSNNRRALLSRTPNIADPLSKTPKKTKEDYNKMILSGKKGAAFVPYPATGHLKPFEEQIIEITLFSDMWGTYRDQLRLEVGDLTPMSIPMEATVVGCPLGFQLTAGQPDVKTIVRFGSHTPGAKPITRKLKVNNYSPVDIRVNWEILQVNNDSEKLIDFITCFGPSFPSEDSKRGSSTLLRNDPSAFSKINLIPSDLFDGEINSDERPNVVSCYLRPHEGDPMLEPFSVSPKEMVVPGHGFNFVNLIYSPGDVAEETDIVGLTNGYFSLDKQDDDDNHVSRREAYDVDHLRLEITANIIPPMLTVEEIDEEGLVIRSAMSDLIKDGKLMKTALSTTSVMLTNNTLANLTFELKVKKPFILADLDTNVEVGSASQAMKTTFCTLKPGDHIVVKTGLRLTKSLLSNSTAEKFDQNLEIRNNLNIKFDNGARQTVPMTGIIAVPQFELSTSTLDFEHCLVGQTRYLEVMLYNNSLSDSYWKIQIEHRSSEYESNMFQVHPSEGVLPAQIDNLSNNKTLITISFTPSHSDCYSVVFQVQGILGEVQRSLLVTGIGSYDGRYEAILNI